MHKQVDVNVAQILNENKQLREELDKSKLTSATSRLSARSFSPGKSIDIRAENKLQINAEFQRLKKENEKLKECVEL